jgi:hypothetical protein
MRTPYTVVLFFFTLIIASCTTQSTPKIHGAIVFGDSALIVTEHDAQYLNNNVPDFVPQQVESIADTVSIAIPVKTDTPRAQDIPIATPVKTSNTKGLQAPFKSLDVFIEGLDAKPARSINWDRASGASFTLNKGELNNKSITVTGATANKVTQRYQTVVTLQTPSGETLKLPGFPVYTAEWQPLKRSNNTFTTAGLADKQLRYEGRFSPNALKNAVQKLVRSNRMSRKEEEQLLRSVRNVRSANQAPLDIVLQSVVWKISATDAKNKGMEREIRVDINR